MPSSCVFRSQTNVSENFKRLRKNSSVCDKIHAFSFANENESMGWIFNDSGENFSNKIQEKFGGFVNFTNKIQEVSEFVVNNNINDLIALDHWALIDSSDETIVSDEQKCR